MSFETANRYNCKFALTLKDITITIPSGQEYRVMPGHIFLSSTSVAHMAAQQGLCRTILASDGDAPLDGDKLLFDRYGANFFEIPYDGARLAVKIELFKQPPAATVFHAFPQREPAAPVIRTGFEY